jgi:glucose-6-phosphate isomerase/transaldolase/glucose-6-phosphate isomerase
LWAEQLIAESTGKRGTGCIPVPTTDTEVGADRFAVRVDLGDPHAVAGEFYRWQLATAAAGHVLGIDPFDEPDVADAKANTARVLADLPVPEPDVADPAKARPWLEAELRPGDYVALQAFLPYAAGPELAALRRRLRDTLGGVAVTAGFGPRYLHSTGQLHKGGPNRVLAVQLLPRAATAQLDVPGAGYDFATLFAAQAEGDYRSLLARDRRVLRVRGDDLTAIA